MRILLSQILRDPDLHCITPVTVVIDGHHANNYNAISELVIKLDEQGIKFKLTMSPITQIELL